MIHVRMQFLNSTKPGWKTTDANCVESIIILWSNPSQVIFQYQSMLDILVYNESAYRTTIENLSNTVPVYWV